MSAEESRPESEVRAEKIGANESSARKRDDQNGIRDLANRVDSLDAQTSNGPVEESAPDDAFAQLTEFLLSPERAKLAELQELIEASRVGPQALSQMLPQAVWQAARKDEKLAAAMGPIMADSFQDSVKRNPKALADAISPIMGPAIRQSIRQAINGMVQSLNQTVEHSFSWNGLKWRWQALQTGRPFAEVVLLNAFVYRVEQVFLIHREDGSLLAHATTGTSGADVDLVSGMLTAIKNFVRQSFGGSEEDSVESMRVGDHHVWIIRSSHAFLAAVIRGVPPSVLRSQLRSEMEAIHEEMSGALAEYDGDNSPFEMVVPRLESCLQSEVRKQESKQPAWVKKAMTACLVLVPLLLLGAVFVWGTQRWLNANQSRRVITALQLPGTATATIDDGVAKVTGSATNAWIQATQSTASSIEELVSIDVSEVFNEDAAWLAYVDRLRSLPGIIVAETAVDNGLYTVTGLRDADAVDPDSLLTSFNLDSSQVNAKFELFTSNEPTFVLRRLLQRTPASPEVSWQVDGDRLVATGSADSEWIAKAEYFAMMARPAIVELRVSAIVESRVDELADLVADIDGTTVSFKKDTSQMLAPQRRELVQLAENIVQLLRAARAKNRRFQFLVVGHTDSSIDSPSSGRMPKERANRVVQQLVLSGVPKESLSSIDGTKLLTAKALPPRTGCLIRVQESP